MARLLVTNVDLLATFDDGRVVGGALLPTRNVILKVGTALELAGEAADRVPTSPAMSCRAADQHPPPHVPEPPPG
jgi:hypothetical protein